MESPGPDAVGACSGKVVTANGGGNTESSTSGCEFSSTDGIITNDVLIPSGTAPTTATATATRPTRVTWYVSSVGSRVMQQHDART